MLSPVRHADLTLQYVRERSENVILFYSGGKDSLVLLDKASKLFNQVVCVFMYFIPNMEHQKPVINYVNKYKNVSIIQYPHWMVSHYIRNGYFLFENKRTDNVPRLKLIDIEDKARFDTGISWILNGAKKSDSLNRNLMLGALKFDAINDKSNRAYPLSLWKKNDVLCYLRNFKIIKPIEYTTAKSNGVDLDVETLIFLRDNYPNDYIKIINTFPLSEKLVFEYDYRKESERNTSVAEI